METLARVDVLCLDKTGTITQGRMELENIITINNSYNVNEIINNLSASLDDDNATMQAIKKYSKPELSYQIDKTIPFSSARKLSAVSYKKQGTYILGAYEFITKNYDSKILKTIEEYANMGKRVLVLAHSNSSIVNDNYEDDIEVIALLLLMDPLRPEAKDTLDYFLAQGVRIKVISGDHPATVNEIARMAGLKYNGKYIDASKLDDDEIAKAAIEYDVFGRVTPAQKKLMIKALKDNGHIVAMSGDGVNDVLALKEADCSIAIASGAEAAKNVANLVLLDSNFASMPHIVDEGRRVINNIQRSASLFLVKTTFSTLLAIITLFLSTKYPFEPIQLTLISTISIGVPGFFLALEANTSRVEGNFLVNVFSKALPGAFMVIICIAFANLTTEIFGFSEIARSTICVILTGSSGLLVLRRVCLPFTKKRIILFSTMCILFFSAVIFAKDIFVLTTLTHFQLILTIAAICTIPPLLDIIAKLLHRISVRFKISKSSSLVAPTIN
ncbi:MAG: HAD-IC family P-type ATPase [Erysipelotrichaceae bacterium]